MTEPRAWVAPTVTELTGPDGQRPQDSAGVGNLAASQVLIVQ